MLVLVLVLVLVAAVGAATRPSGWWGPARHLARWWAPVAPDPPCLFGFLGADQTFGPTCQQCSQKPPTTRLIGRFFLCPPIAAVALTIGRHIGYRQTKTLKMAPTNKRTGRPRKNQNSAILSRKPFFVARQTPRPPDTSHSLKPAKMLSRCPHTRQGVKRLLAPSRRLSELISATYGSQPQKPTKCNPYKDFFHNCPPSTFLLRLASLVTIVHNRPPIDSPVPRSTNRGMRIPYMIRNADPPDGIDHHCLYDKEC